MEPYSVLLSVYARERPEYLKQSVASMVGQSVRPAEFVVVCDGPLTPALDGVLDRADRENPGLFCFVRLPQNVGLGGALDAGLRACSNELVARMDSDDIAFHDRCARQIEALARRGADVVSAWVDEFSGTPDNVVAVRRVPETHAEIVAFSRRRNPFNHPCVLFRRSAVLAAGGYQPFELFEDYFLWVRMLRAGAVGYNIPQPLLWMRAGRALYERRSGVRYLRSMVRFKTYLRREGYISRMDYAVSVAGRGLVCLMPGGLRSALYRRFLRADKA